MDSTPLLRPTFTLPLNGSREEAIEAIRTGFTRSPAMAGRWRGKGQWAELYLPESERRLWSPYLSIRLDEAKAGESGCALFGRFAPHPEVWTFFMFLYFLIAFLVLFGGTLGYVQWASDEAAWGLWAVWIGLPAIGLIHVASAVGERLGREQMQQLHAELEGVLRDVPGLIPEEG